MKGHNIHTTKINIPENDDLFKVDEHFGLDPGTTYKTIVGHCEPTVLNLCLEQHSIQLEDFGMVPKSQRPQWKALMQGLKVGSEYWKDKSALEVPAQEIKDLT